MKKFLTLDVGTTAVKAGPFNEALTPLAFVIREYQLLTPGGYHRAENAILLL